MLKIELGNLVLRSGFWIQEVPRGSRGKSREYGCMSQIDKRI